MNDKECRNQIKRVKALLDKWEKPCGFRWFQIEHTFSRDNDQEGQGTGGCTASQWQYRNAWITWFLPVIAELTDEQLEEMVVHELCHTLISPIENYEDKMAERTELATTNVERALRFAYEAGKKAA